MRLVPQKSAKEAKGNDFIRPGAVAKAICTRRGLRAILNLPNVHGKAALNFVRTSPVELQIYAIFPIF
jgi:hypothetical protein